MGVNLERLVEDILKESRAKAEEIKKEGLTQIEDSIAKARADAAREAGLIARDTKTECEATVIRRVSREKQKARLAYLTAKNSVLDHVMSEVQTKLAEFSRDDSRYPAFLLKAIVRGMEAVPSDAVKVALSDSDLRRYGGSKLVEDALAKMQTPKTAVLNDEAVRTIGGAVVMSQDDKVRVDCTLEARLGLMKTQLLAEMSKILFASQ